MSFYHRRRQQAYRMHVNITEQFSSRAVMFVLIILSICLLAIIDISTHLNNL
jgi:hypothetical protein